MRLETLAEIVHEANAAYSRGIGDLSHHRWADTPSDIQQSAKEGILTVLRNPAITVEELHDMWVTFKARQGWIHGLTKSESEKTHPDLIPFNELSQDVRNKDLLFLSIVLPFLDQLEYDEFATGDLAL